MTYYAKINNNNIVEAVIVADADVIATMDGAWVETSIDGNYAGIGHGFDGLNFVPRLFENSAWDGSKWVTPFEMGIVGEASNIIAADGIAFVPIYLISTPNSQEAVEINGEFLTVSTDARGYGELELSSDTEGMMTVAWGGFTLEVYAYVV